MIEDVQKMIKDYEPPQVNIFTEEDEEMIMLKQAVQALPPADKIIFLLYAEYGSLRQVAKELGGISHTTIYKQIKIIKNEIKEWCNEHYPNNNIFK
jgi:transcriptional regulator of aromatic amino acid metabolism